MSLALMLACTMAHPLVAQRMVGGLTVDADEKPVPFANVMLMSLPDSIFVKGEVTKSNGTFTLEVEDKFRGYFEVSSLGFETRRVALQTRKDSYVITLTTLVSELDNVVITGKKSLFVQQSDRLVVNVSGIPDMAGNNALQVLKKSPGVVVLENQNSISLNGKGEVLMMINNKISRIPLAVLMKQLQGMQAENIDRIELIHQPGAKYEASNSAGIIHIVMKENMNAGFGGNAALMTGYGQREKFSVSTSLNYRKGKLNVYGDVTGTHSRSPRGMVDHFREFDYQGDKYSYENKLLFADPNNRTIGFNAGADYQLNKKTIVGGLAGYTTSRNIGNDYTSRSKSFLNGELLNNFNYLMDSQDENYNTFFNLNFFRQIDEHSSFNIDLDKVVLDVVNSSNLKPQSTEDIFSDSDILRDSRFDLYIIKGDYEWNGKNGFKIESGAKATFNSSNTRSSVVRQDDNSSVDPAFFRRSDEISEKILALYSSVKGRLGPKWETEAGLRLEHYEYDLKGITREQDFNTSYTNPFPLVRLSHKIDSASTLALSFNRRINRPSFFHLARFYALIDPNLFVSSNTRLRPAFTNALRLAYQKRNFILALEINRTLGAIEWHNTVDKARNLQYAQPINFDEMESLLLNLSFPLAVGEFWTANWNIQGAYNRVTDASNRALPFRKSLFTATIQLNNTFILGNDWTVSLGGRYMSPYLGGDQVKYLKHYINLGLSKKLKNESMLTFGIQDITATSGIHIWEYHQPELGIRTYGDNDFSERVFQLTYNFPFGNQKLKQRRSRVTGSKEERDRM